MLDANDESNLFTSHRDNQNNITDREELPDAGASSSQFMSNLVDTTSNVALAFSTPSISIGNPQNNRLNTTSILKPALKRLHSSSSFDDENDQQPSRQPLLACRMASLNVEIQAKNEDSTSDFFPIKNSVRFEKNCISRSISMGGNYANDFDAQHSPTLKNQAMSRRASLFVRRISMAIPSLSGDPIPQSVVGSHLLYCRSFV